MVALESYADAPAKVAAPGRYAIDMATYHSDCCVGPSVSGSGLWTLWSRSPAHFFAEWSGNPEREERADTDAFAFGRAAHLFALNDGSFDEHFAVLPYPDRRTKEARAWCEEARASGRAVLTEKDAERVTQTAMGLMSNDLVRAAFRGGEGEVSYIWQDKATGIWLKARPDWSCPAPRPIYDLKFHADCSPRAFSRDAFAYGYHMKAALALMGVEAVTGERRSAYAFIACEKAAPFASVVYAIEKADIEYGQAIVRRALDRLARCIEDDVWPGYADDVVSLDRPRWLDAEAEALCQGDA